MAEVVTPPPAAPNSGSTTPANGTNTGGVAGGGVLPTTASTAPAPINASPSTPSNTPSQGWLDTFSPEHKGYIETKGFKNANDIVDSYRNLEKLNGASKQLIKLPENGNVDVSTPEGRAIFERLGAPKEAKEYNFQETIKDENSRNWTAETMRELGITKNQAESLVSKFNERETSAAAALQISMQAQQQQAMANLRNEWGNAFEQNQNKILETARVLGIDEKGLGALNMALGPEKAPKLLLKLSAATSESNFIGGSQGPSIMSADQAKAQIKASIADKGFQALLMKGDATAKQKWQDLHASAFPGIKNLV